MGGSAHILVMAETPESAARVAAMVAECGVEGARTTAVAWADAAAAHGLRTWDVLVAVPPADPAALEAIAPRAVTVVLVAPELTQDLAIVAQGLGASVCLVDHGVKPLRLALLRGIQAAGDRRASERIRALVQRSVADVIFNLRVEGDRFRFVEINPAFTRATGLAPEQVIGKFVDEVIPEPSLSLVLGRYREAIAEARTVRWEEITEYPTGTKIGEVSVTPVVDVDGRCTNLIGTVQDVTEARQQADQIRLYADVVENVRIGLTVWTVRDPDDTATIRLAAFNPEAARLSGVDLVARRGLPIDQMGVPGARPILRLVQDVARDAMPRSIPQFRLPSDGRTFSAQAFPLPSGAVGLAFDDITVQARARALAAVEQRVLEMCVQGAPVGDALEVLVRAIEAEAPPAIASVLLLSPDGTRVVHGAAPSLPAEYNRAIDGAPIGPKAGSCGTAAALRRSIIVTDIETDPLWEDYRDLARRFGLRACWSTPITGRNDRVLGTFALYYREPRAPSALDLEMIARATHVAGIALERYELDEQLRELSAHIDVAREEERTGIAREIHDQLGQALTVLKMDLAWLARRAQGAEGLAPDVLLEKLRGLMQMADQIIQEVRRISAELRPAILDDIGLDAALAWAGQELERRTPIRFVIHSTITDSEQLRGPLATAVFRVFQEALTNIVRHADATRIDVDVAERDGALALEIRDDGRGIPAEAVEDRRSLGLLGMRERARRVGGTLTFARAEPHGTVVTLQVPLARAP